MLHDRGCKGGHSCIVSYCRDTNREFTLWVLGMMSFSY